MENTTTNGTAVGVVTAASSYLPCVTFWLYCISIPIFLALGTTGNGLVIIVLYVRKMRPYPSSLLLVLLAIFDTLVLWTGHFRNFYITIFSDFRSASWWGCVTHVMVSYLTVSISVWVLVTVTVQRLIAVYFPLKAKTLLTMRRTVISSVILIICCTAFNVHFIETVGLVPRGGVITCFSKPEYEYFVVTVWPKLDLIVNSIVPFFVLLFCNSTIIYKVRTGSKLLSKDVKDYKSASNKANTTMTVMLVSVNIIFLFTTAPYAIYNCDVFRPWIQSHSDEDDFFYALVYIIQCVNSAGNFYIYCLSGKRFRDEFKATFTKAKVRRESVYERTTAGVNDTTRSTNKNHINGHAKCGKGNAAEQDAMNRRGKSAPMREVESNCEQVHEGHVNLVCDGNLTDENTAL